MKKIITLSLIGLFPFLLEAQNTWEKKTSFPASKRARSVSFSIASRGYLVAGEDTLDIEKNDCWEYDPGSDSWTQKATMPGPGRRDAVGFAIGQKGYVGTGIDAPDAYMGNTMSDFWEYNPITNAWLQKTSYPGAGGWGIYFATGFAISGKGFVCGGKVGASSYSQELWEYNPTLNSWVQRSSFPGGVRYGQSSFVLNNKAYVGCGTDENWFTSDFWEFNPGTNTWTQKSAFPGSARSFCSAFAVNGKGYFGMGTDGGYRNDWFEYDVTTDSWMPAAPFGGQGRRSAPTFVIAGAGYVMTGKGVTGKVRDMWEYKPFINGIEENNFISVNVYPNPASEVIHFDFGENFSGSNENLSIQLINVEGKIIAEQKLNGNSHIDLYNQNWAKGIYMYSLTNGTKIISGGRIVIR